ncbi:MAG: hypothetical protein PHF74_00900 [Dehalococcoidales bacterium]|nr:hypothetical protein [Dehalococcoidales bacterium]
MPKEKKKSDSQELGKIEKPEAEKFQKGRKLIFVPLLFAPHENETELQKLHDKYWQQVAEQINNLESKLLDITRVYHEFICTEGEEGLKEIERMDAGSYDIVNNLVKKGSKLMAAESVELLGEFMDWNKCLSTRISSQKVITKIYEFYNEALKSREEWIRKGIDLTLGEDEFGLLIMRENNKIQFPSNVEVFYVAPPSLDEIKRWVREKRSSLPQTPKKEEKPAAKKSATKKTSARKISK